MKKRWLVIFGVALSLLLMGFGGRDPLPLKVSCRMSQCVEDCKEPEKIIQNLYADHKLDLRFNIISNCADKEASVEQKHDTLFVELHCTPEMHVHEQNGRMDTIYSYYKLGCECFYRVEMTIEHLAEKPSVLFVNDRLVQDSLFARGAHGR